MSITNILLEFNTEEKADRLVKFLKDHSFLMSGDRMDKYYVGSGVFATVYASSKYPDIVVRVGGIGSDHINAINKLVGKKLDNVVEVKYNKEVKEEKYVTIMEKLEEINDTLKFSVDSVSINYEDEVRFRVMDAHEFYEEADNDLEGLKEAWDIAMEQSDDGMHGSYDLSAWEDVKDHVVQVANGLKNLRANGIVHRDAHWGNIMWDPKKKQYKLIDLS